MHANLPHDLRHLRNKLLKDGAVHIPNFITQDTIIAINKELAPWLSQINFNDTLGYTLKGHSKWLYYLAMCSRTATHLALSENFLDFIATVFGEEPIISELQVQISHDPMPKLPFHSDRDGGIGVFIYLTSMNEENGQFGYIPGTQNEGNHFWIPENELEGRNIVNVNAKQGDAFLFDQDIWHTRAQSAIGGRGVLWLMFHPQNRTDAAVDHILRQSIMEGLSPRQLQALGVGREAFKRPGILRSLGKPFAIPELKTFLRYLFQHRRLSRSAPPETSVKNYGYKILTGPPRQRAAVDSD